MFENALELLRNCSKTIYLRELLVLRRYYLDEGFKEYALQENDNWIWALDRIFDLAAEKYSKMIQILLKKKIKSLKVENH